MARGYAPEEDAILRDAPTTREAYDRLAEAGFERTLNSVYGRLVHLGLIRISSRTQHYPGAGRTRAQNRALWTLAESNPTPAVYARRRSKILGDEPQP